VVEASDRICERVGVAEDSLEDAASEGFEEDSTLVVAGDRELSEAVSSCRSINGCRIASAACEHNSSTRPVIK
jgi:hypothetical protein